MIHKSLLVFPFRLSAIPYAYLTAIPVNFGKRCAIDKKKTLIYQIKVNANYDHC